MPEPVPSKPAHRSLTIASVLAMAIAFVAERLGLQAPPGAIDVAAQAVIDLIFSLGLIGVSLGRARARAPLS